MTVVPYEQWHQRDEPSTRRDWIDLMAPAVELAKAIANTEFVPKAFRGNPAAITAAILYGDEVGLGPMQSLKQIAVVEGTPTLYAEAQRALIFQAGHDLWVEEATTTRVTLAGRRKDSDQTNRATWTMDDAKRAGLSGRPAWRAYPQDMLLARATARLARAVFADAIGGLAAREEFEDTAAARPEDSAAAAEQPTSRRKRATTSATVSSPPADEPKPEPSPLPPLPGEPEDSAAGPGPTQTAPAASLRRGRTRQEQDSDDAPAPPAAETITEPQRRRLMALFRANEFTTREGRLAFATLIVGRTITTSSELTVDEASRLIEALEKRSESPAQGELPEDY
jgi:hypothetical protein